MYNIILYYTNWNLLVLEHNKYPENVICMEHVIWTQKYAPDLFLLFLNLHVFT